jgi:hypothetical protein
MEELKAPALSWLNSVHNLVGVEGIYRVNRKNGEFDFESITLIMTDANGHIETFGLYSHVEGSLAQLPITTAE